MVVSVDFKGFERTLAHCNRKDIEEQPSKQLFYVDMAGVRQHYK